MKILVTGGSGFIGTYLISDLLKEGHKVVIYDKVQSEAYPDLCIVGDVLDKKKLANSMRGMDAVYHLAAEHRDDVRPVSLYEEVNVGGARNVVHGLEKNGINMLIFTSTVALYGLNLNNPNEGSPAKPFNDYSRSKYEAELVFNEWADADNARCLVIVRPTVIFGEGNRGNVYNLLSQIASQKFIMVGNGKNKKSMGYVRNLSKFLVFLLTNMRSLKNIHFCSSSRKAKILNTDIHDEVFRGLKFESDADTLVKHQRSIGQKGAFCKGLTDLGAHVYNYADKPDFNMEELVCLVLKALGNGRKANFRLPYGVGLLGGYAFDLLAKLTGKTYPISSIRIKKFCADTIISAEKLKQTGFTPPYSLAEGLNRTIASEFLVE